jgi:nucleotide-binding universal stress UspA family protein
MGFQAYVAAGQQHAAHAHASVAKLAGEVDRKIQVEARLVEDATAVHGILDTAKTEAADLIVVGSHGRTGVARLMVGSVAAKVVAQSTVPVLVAR